MMELQMTSGTVVNGFGSWQALGSGIPNGEVNAIETSPNGDVFHGGSFSQAGGISA